MGIMKIHLGIVWENTTPSTELPSDFCAGSGPLQLGVVLVFLNFFFKKWEKSVVVFKFEVMANGPGRSRSG